MLFTIETTADHHQVPRVRMNRVPGTIKTETGTGQENGRPVCTGYRNIIGAPQAYAIWGTMLVTSTIETTAHHHQVPRVRIKSLLGDPRVIKNNVLWCCMWGGFENIDN